MPVKTALLFAAGRGERLRPLTDRLPKPLCLVKDKALIDYHLEHLAQAGFERIIINHAHLGGKIRQHLHQKQNYGLEIVYSAEPPGALETGGGLYQARKLLGHDPFLAINADIFTDYPFSTEPPKTLKTAHLILVRKPIEVKTADFALSPQGLVNNTPKELTYSGIAWYHPDIFTRLSPGRYSITPILRALCEEHVVTGELYEGLWSDIGTPQRLQTIEAILLER